jgi:hypothetical protein
MTVFICGERRMGHNLIEKAGAARELKALIHGIYHSDLVVPTNL